MKKIDLYLTFIVWSIMTIILGVLMVIFWPILFVWKKLHAFSRKYVITNVTRDPEPAFEQNISLSFPSD